MTAPRDGARDAPRDPGPVIGEILFDLVCAACAYQAGRTVIFRKRLKDAYSKLTVLRVENAAAARAERLPKVGGKR